MNQMANAVLRTPFRIGDCDVVALAREYGTPLYIYDENGLRENCRRFVKAFKAGWPRMDVTYACKAFAVGAMLRLAHDEGLGLDVASVGELSLARSVRIPSASITFHGAYKKREELETAIQAGVGHVVVDSLEEVGDLIAAARHLDRMQPVLVRINPDVAVATDVRYRASGGDSKFGLSVADGTARRAAEDILASRYLRLDGVHFHLGSQIMAAEPYVEAIGRTATFVADLQSRHTWAPSRMVIGGGMGVSYGAEPEPTPEYWAAALTAAFRARLAPLCAPHVTLGIEPGRAVVARHGVIAYTVGVIKPRSAGPGQIMIVVDGGLSDNPRPLMYSAAHEVVHASTPCAPARMTADIYGRHCETDLLFGGVDLPATCRGDILAVLMAGAYTHCMASNYNRFTRAAVVFAANGTSRAVVRRETQDDLLLTEQLAPVGVMAR